MKHRHLAAALASALFAATAVAAFALPQTATPQTVPVSANSSPGTRDVIVHLFEWPWASIASECTNVLGPKGFGAVQVSPPQEHVVLSGQSNPWWQDYQPVSYQLVSRRGDRAAFASMVSTCHAAGVKIYVDAVLNHMAGGASTGVGSAGSTYSQYNYPNAGYTTNDFHHCGRNGNDDIVSWGDRWEVQNCELVDLSDLKTEAGNVRGKLTAYLNDLVGLGVDGFRVDAAKHVPVADLQAIYGGVSGSPYIYQEVIEGGSGEISPSEYTGIGDVTEFRSGDVVGNAFRDGNLSGLNGLPGSMLLSSGDAVTFVDNHDTQRNGRARLTYKNGSTYGLAEAFLLAYNYGTPALMSSFTFSNNEAGPPTAGNGTTNQVTCGSGWECEHRWRTIANLVGFHNAVAGTSVTNWWSNGSSQIGFGRGANGYAVFNRGSSLTQTFTTGLPAGTYCDVANGDFSGTSCSGAVYTVNGSGQFTATVAGGSMLALHINARTSGNPSPSPSSTPSGCTTVAVTFSVTAATTSGQNVFVTGSITPLTNWSTTAPVALTSGGNQIWSGTVNIPAGQAFEYKYIKKDGAGAVTWESISNRSRTVPTGVCAVTVSETWNNTTQPSPSPTGGACTSVAATFAENATTVLGQNVYVVGSIPQLGTWAPGSAILLSSATYPVWTGTVTLPPNTTFQYKYIKKDGSGNVIWESDPNRSRTTPSTAPCTATYSESWR
ncbi:alpha-amylase [Allocatelliglobosispora scoriae]|uniref:Alpha-amylase n=1 Tax=Allocatelliglobosispora scoriae TaxID=643052 RepID=A0A841BRP6_9ACTN|nr:carbohydrate-binding module family 20 domain-containing protein [Allocatelliglobosispora scoriae]MBB5869583.1 alpha-amylase [Allocatelliglobosispora scoriae]